MKIVLYQEFLHQWELWQVFKFKQYCEIRKKNAFQKSKYREIFKVLSVGIIRVKTRVTIKKIKMIIMRSEKETGHFLNLVKEFIGQRSRVKEDNIND